MHISNLVTKVDRSKKVNTNLDDINYVLGTLFSAFNAFNDLEEDETFFIPWNRDISNIYVPSELKVFILPSSVKVDPLRRMSLDLLDRKSFKFKMESKSKDGNKLNLISDECPSYHLYVEAIERLRGLFKRNPNEDLTALSDIKKNVSLFDVLDKISDKAKIRSNWEEAFIPIPVNFKYTVFYDENYFLGKVEDIVEDYIYNKLFFI